MSKKKLPPKPEGYDDFLGDLVDLIRQHQSKAGGKAKPKQPATKKSPTPKPLPAKKRKEGRS